MKNDTTLLESDLIALHNSWRQVERLFPVLMAEIKTLWSEQVMITEENKKLKEHINELLEGKHHENRT